MPYCFRACISAMLERLLDSLLESLCELVLGSILDIPLERATLETATVERAALERVNPWWKESIQQEACGRWKSLALGILCYKHYIWPGD